MNGSQVRCANNVGPKTEPWMTPVLIATNGGVYLEVSSIMVVISTIFVVIWPIVNIMEGEG